MDGRAPLTPDPPMPLRVRSPEDLIAVTPVVLGFPAREAVVVLALGGRRSPCARVDLPRDPGDVPVLVETLVGAMTRNGVGQVAVLCFDGDEGLVDVLGRALLDALTLGGVEVIELLAVREGRFRSMLPGRLGPAEGVPYDVSEHPFVAAGVLAGRATYASREELARTLARDEDAAARVAGRAGGPDAHDRVAATLWARGRVLEAVAARRPLDDGELARLLVDLVDLHVRDEVWHVLTHDNAAAWVELWSDACRKAPAPLGAAPAVLAGFGAWVSGNGALAWCAVERAEADRPGYSCAGLLAQLLEAAAPPELWDRLAAGWATSHDPA